MSDAKPAKSSGSRRAWIIASVVVVGPIVVALFLRIFVLEAFKVPAGSMAPTLLVGDHMFVKKWSDAPRRGVVFVFHYPENVTQDFVKRVVATSGDTLEVLDGRPVVSGKIAPQCHVGAYVTDSGKGELYLERLDDRTYGVLHDDRVDETKCGSTPECRQGETCEHGLCVRQKDGPFTVKPGEFWVLGDNRNNSHDSRSWNGGMGGGVRDDLVVGEALSVFLSMPSGRSGASAQGVPRLSGANAGLQSALDKCAARLASP